ncbi:hypothetical protein ABVT39_024258 [Epinephelus coioides]
MTIHSMAKVSVLKVKVGKYVTVRQSADGVKLCAWDSQTELYVDIYTRQIDNKNQMAFCFHYKGGRYLLKVGNTGMNLEQITPSVRPSRDEHWFEKVQQNVGDKFGLRSVGDSSKYLSLDANGKTIVCHSEMNMHGLFTCYSKA